MLFVVALSPLCACWCDAAVADLLVSARSNTFCSSSHLALGRFSAGCRHIDMNSRMPGSLTFCSASGLAPSKPFLRSCATLPLYSMYGYWLVAISSTHMPNDQMSTSSLYESPNISGDRKPGVPTMDVGLYDEMDRPKSPMRMSPVVESMKILSA